MRVLTVMQPWASLIVAGHKTVESRTWQTSYRGPLLIHAGQRVDYDAWNHPLVGPALRDVLDDPHGRLPHGVLLGAVDLWDCIQGSPDPWAIPGQWHWLLRRPSKARTPLAIRGRQGLYLPPANWPDAWSSCPKRLSLQ